MPRPKKLPHNRVRKDGFSGPRYLIAAARAAAEVPKGNDFSPWLVAAIEEKLDRDYPGLREKVRAALNHPNSLPVGDRVEEREAASRIDELVAWAIEIERLTHAAVEAKSDSGSLGQRKPRAKGR